MEQRYFRMPATGEAWRHYKGGGSSLYTIIGMALDENGNSQVVYTPYGWGLAQFPPIYTQPIIRFLQHVENDRPRFKFEREAGDDKSCAFIRQQLPHVPSLPPEKL